MWNSEKVLSNVAKRTAMSIADIQRCPWSELEKKMQITKIFEGRTISRRGHHHVGMRKITRAMFDEDEKQLSYDD